MPNSLLPSQIGWIQSGVAQDSRLIIGKDTRVNWEAIGFGPAARPDIANQVIINLTRVSGVATPTFLGSIVMDVSTLVNILAGPSSAPTTGFQIAFREVDVCDDGNPKKMVILASQTYAP